MRHNYRVLMDIEFTTGVLNARRRLVAGTVVGLDFLKNPDTAHILKPHHITPTTDPIGPPPRGWQPDPVGDEDDQKALDLQVEKTSKKFSRAAVKSSPPA